MRAYNKGWEKSTVFSPPVKAEIVGIICRARGSLISLDTGTLMWHTDLLLEG